MHDSNNKIREAIANNNHHLWSAKRISYHQGKLKSAKILEVFKENIDAIEWLYKELDDDLKSHVHSSYWNKDGCYEWVDVADKLSMSRKKVLRLRNMC